MRGGLVGGIAWLGTACGGFSDPAGHHDAPSIDSLTCNDDAAYEGPSGNDTLAHAYALPDLATQPSCTVTYSTLAICPSNDKDFYSVVTSTDAKTIQATVRFDATGAALQGSITNTGGVPIKNLIAVGANVISASAADLPSGEYYTEVFGTGVNNYSLTIAMTPCP